VAGAWALAARFGVLRAMGAVVAAVGAVLAVFGGLIGLIGLEAALTAWNDEMALLPWGLSRILGISVYLDIPADTAWWAAIAGVVLVVVGAAVVALGALTARSRRSTSPA